MISVVTCFSAVFDLNGFSAVPVGSIGFHRFFRVIEIYLDVLIHNLKTAEKHVKSKRKVISVITSFSAVFDLNGFTAVPVGSIGFHRFFRVIEIYLDVLIHILKTAEKHVMTPITFLSTRIGNAS